MHEVYVIIITQNKTITKIAVMGIELSTTYALYHLIIKIALLFLFSEEEVHAQKNNLLQVTRLVKGGDHI